MGRYLGKGRDTVEDCRVLDITYLHRHEMLTPGYSSTLYWLRNDVRVASIITCAVDNAVILNYRHQSRHNSEWQDVEQRVPLNWTDCNYGG